MCSTCGCGADDVRVQVLGEPPRHADQDHRHADHDHQHPGHPYDLDHPHDLDHPQDHVHSGAVDHAHLVGRSQLGHLGDEDRTHTIRLEQAVLAKNDHLAAHNRAWLAARGLTAVNLMSSPGAGKTTLLERTITGSGLALSVVEGDQETTFDAERIRAAGARTVQVNTGAGCHLDAAMVSRALEDLRPEPGVVMIENVGNLVCPALFDLGEARRVVIISVTEGDDKPLKYPHMFAAADLVVVNKTDLLPYVEFDIDRLTDDARKLRPGVDVLALSARTGDNLDRWYAWLDALHKVAVG